MLKRISEIPVATRGGGRVSYVEQDIRTFIRNETMDTAELIYEGKKGACIATSARKYIRSNPDLCKGIGVVRQGEHVYIYKEIVR